MAALFTVQVNYRPNGVSWGGSMSYLCAARARRTMPILVSISASATLLVSAAVRAEDAKPAQLPPVTVDVGNQPNPPKAKTAHKPNKRVKSVSFKAKPENKKKALPARETAETNGLPANAELTEGGGFGSTGNGGTAQGLQQVPALGKTGTAIGDIPASVQIIPKKVLDEQGATTVQQSITNASGIVSGGQDALGYF